MASPVPRLARRLGALAAAALALAILPAASQPPATGAPLKVLRDAFLIAETNFDPVAVDDEYSHRVIEEILEAPLTYDFLARPAKLKPQTLEAMPEITDEGRTYTLHLKKGIYYSDDPAFNGRKRELVAADYEFAMKRLVDPRLHSPNLWLIEDAVLGVKQAAERARKAGKLDYDAPIPGIEVVDRYTLRIRLVKSDYDFSYVLAMTVIVAQAREVVERYGADIGAHPVGTGPFRLVEWRRSSKIVLERNPNFREEYYDADPPADDPLSQQLLRENKGKRMPMVDRVEISVIEESQPRWLAFLNDELDWVNMPYEFLNMAVPRGKLSPALAKKGVRYMPDIEPVTTYTYYNMNDPVLGGYTAEKVALRRAIRLAYNNDEEVNVIRNGQAIVAETIVPPGVWGYDAGFDTGAHYDPARAKALLDMYGYVDRNGDGWRELPDGQPFVFHYATDPSQLSRLFTELFQKDLAAVGIRMDVEVAKWPDLRKKSKAGQLPDWAAAWGADYPDGQNFYQLLYGPNCHQSNDGCFALPEYDRLYEKAISLPFGPERLELYHRMDRVIAAYAPVLLQTHRKYNYMAQPWLLGWRKHPILKMGYKYADIDLAKKAELAR